MIAILMLVGWVVLVVAVLCMFAGGAETTCTHNCNQGRNCTCVRAKSNHA